MLSVLVFSYISAKHNFKKLSGSTKYSSEELVSLVKSKSQQGFTALYDNYSGTLYGIILKIVQDEDAAQDILQDSFVKIWKNIDNFDRSKGTLFTWMLNISRNRAIDYRRSKHVKYRIQLDDSIVGIEDDSGEAVKTDYIGVKEAIRKLRPEYIEVLDMIYIQGFTQKETSETLDIALGTIKTRSRAAIKQLRELLGEA